MRERWGRGGGGGRDRDTDRETERERCDDGDTLLHSDQDLSRFFLTSFSLIINTVTGK